MLHRALKEQGKLKQTIIQLHLSGTARSGKTSLARRLMGKNAREDEPSTGVATNVARVDIVKNSVLVEEAEWRVLRDLYEESSVILINGIGASMSHGDRDYHVESDSDQPLADVSEVSSRTESKLPSKQSIRYIYSWSVLHVNGEYCFHMHHSTVDSGFYAQRD